MHMLTAIRDTPQPLWRGPARNAVLVKTVLVQQLATYSQGALAVGTELRSSMARSNMFRFSAHRPISGVSGSVCLSGKKKR